VDKKGGGLAARWNGELVGIGKFFFNFAGAGGAFAEVLAISARSMAR